MLDWLGDENENDDKWQKEDGKWVAHAGNFTLVVEKVGWLFPSWQYRLVLHEGVEQTMSEAMEKAEKAIAKPKQNVLRLVRG